MAICVFDDEYTNEQKVVIGLLDDTIDAQFEVVGSESVVHLDSIYTIDELRQIMSVLEKLNAKKETVV